MAIYLINLISIPIWYLALAKISDKQRRELLVINIVCVQMALIAGLRAINIGVDTKNYQAIFNEYKVLPWNMVFSTWLEPGYVIYNKLVALFGLPYRIVIIINTAVTIIGIRNFILKTSDDKIMSLFLFIAIGYFSSMMNIMRQYLATVLILNSFAVIINKEKPIKAIVYSLVAALFHTSALIMLAVIVLYYVLYCEKNRNNILLKLLAFGVGSVMVVLIDPIISLIPFLNYESLKYAAAYEYSLFDITFILKIVCVGISLFLLVDYRYKVDEQSLHKLSFLNYLMIASCLLNVASVSFNMFTRLNMYFAITLIVLVPLLIKNIPIREKRFIKCCVYVLGTVMYVISLSGASSLVPYAFL